MIMSHLEATRSVTLITVSNGSADSFLLLGNFQLALLPWTVDGISRGASVLFLHLVIEHLRVLSSQEAKEFQQRR